MKKWDLLYQQKTKNTSLTIEQLTQILLQNRGIKTKKEVDEFINPQLEKVTWESVGIDKKEHNKTLQRIEEAIVKKEQIVIFGDYDVDGITATAILWETLHSLGASVTPYIPHRIDEGYGLSLAGIKNLQEQVLDIRLIITVDNGIVATKAVDYANTKQIDVIVTDHHTKGKIFPNAYSIFHTTKLCGAGIAWLLGKEIRNKSKTQNETLAVDEDIHLELAALGTVADLVPLVGPNRTIVKFGLEKLRQTSRPGLLALLMQAASDQTTLGVYEIGHIIAPRLNAAGRLESAMDSLRLLCTKDSKKAFVLAEKLGTINKERQNLMKEAAQHASLLVRSQQGSRKKFLFISHESYQQGVIGLVAGKLVEEFYRPSVVIAIGEKYSKASGRSIAGFNLIEFLRFASEHLVDVGGHPMAAGFTVETEKIALLQQTLETLAEKMLTDDLLVRSLRIDCTLDLDIITEELYKKLQELSPFGMGNPEPTFVSTAIVQDKRIIGREGTHLRLQLSSEKSGKYFEAIGFGLGERVGELSIDHPVQIVYTIDENNWNGNKKLQLKIKDIKR